MLTFEARTYESADDFHGSGMWLDMVQTNDLDEVADFVHNAETGGAYVLWWAPTNELIALVNERLEQLSKE